MTNVVLKDTSLCAIVRDEMMNPAGGIERFVRSIVPHVEQAVIFDTGSVDGTREKLEELYGEFPHMKVYNRPFDNYVNSRNASLEKVRTDWTLVLDADELIIPNGFENLQEFLSGKSARLPDVGYSFQFIKVDSTEHGQDNVHNPRLFRNSPKMRYESSSGCWEYLIYQNPVRGSIFAESDDTITLQNSIPIYHFTCENPSMEQLKRTRWYNEPEKWKNSPSKARGFKKWKAFNPQRNMEKFN